ncbi:MAG: type II toxin-antitoxin system VapC family toxin [Alphaproteobacteria bacterium]|nr:type II toxin-antitoxin system VapC family toxin [Alphaproteobacteria bacterium]
MRLLIDTHILLWSLLSPERLPPSARSAIMEPAHDVLVSVASLWEIAIKHALGRLHLPIERLPALVTELGCTVLPITAPHALAAGALPRHHADPFDRMLIAQARHEGLTLVTVDAAFTQYDVPLLG